MSLLKALGKAVLRSSNEILFNSDKKRAKQKAYNNVGSIINRATKNGSYINGTLTYKKELRLQTLKAKQRYINRDKFIGDL